MPEHDETTAYVVNGYQFETKEDYDAALKEKKGILYLNEQLDKNEPARILQLYNELIEKKLFITPVGIDFLKQLRAALLKAGGISRNDVLPVYVPSKSSEDGAKNDRKMSARYEKDIKDLETGLLKQKNGKRTSIILNVVLAAVVVAMFIIASTTSNANIINYERVLQDKYASWAEDLKEKEQELNEKQRELQSIEESLQSVDNSHN